MIFLSSTVSLPPQSCGRIVVGGEWCPRSGAIIVPKTQLSITSRIRIPVGNWGHPLRQRWLLDNVLCKGRLRHLCGYELRKGGEEGTLYSRASRGGFGCEAVVVD